MTAVRDRIMGTDVLVAGLGPALQAEVFTALRHVERVFTRFRADSDTSRVNAAGGRPVPVSPLFAAVLQEACAHAARTRGVFSPLLGVEVAATGYDTDLAAVPGRPPRPLPPAGTAPRVEIDHDAGTVAVEAGTAVDLGGFVKGRAVQRVADDLRSRGVPRGLIDAGGDIAAWHEPGGPPWRVGIAHPGGAEPVATLSLGPVGAVATSSTARRAWTGADGVARHHVIDPRTGLPTTSGCVQATVTGPDLGAAEVLATCLLVLGPAAGPRCRPVTDDPDVRWWTVDVAGRVRRGGGAPR